MILARRAFLRMGAAALLTTGTEEIAWAANSPNAGAGIRRLKFENLHTGEKLDAVYCVEGCYQPDVLQAVNHTLRDFRTGDVHAIDPRLLDLLHDLNSRLDNDAAIQVISGYRSPATNAMMHERSSGVAAKSLHMEGMAIDIRLPNRPLQAVHDTALSLGKGGVGFYPISNFVHVDVGRVRTWARS
jgi:uncharacterized protein YcbK (DUF882 family)